jgi:hypothetical protein
VKDAQTGLHKIIIWTKKCGMGKQKWEKACVESGLLLRKFKTLSKQDLQAKSLCLNNVLNLKKPSFFVMASIK